MGNLDSARMYQITATLRVQTDLVQMWVEQGLEVDEDELAHSAHFFEEQIYPTNHDYFGSEWSPGIDGDPHLIILNANVQGAAGYFALANEYPRDMNPYSNECEMFVINAASLQPGTTAYHATLAHEFQHMIHWHSDRNEEAWLNEGASELAEELNGFTVSRSAIKAFERQPDLQLNTWTSDPDTMGAHYGASHLFLRYALTRFGPHTLKAVVQNPQNGIWSFDGPLQEYEPALSFDALFADWVVANILDQSAFGDERYLYPDMDVNAEIVERVQSYPHTIEGSVHQYGADYIELVGIEKYPSTGDGGSSLRISFSGTPHVKLVPNTPASGRFQWWSNRGDASHSSLERTFDLTDVSTATLSFNLWYDIEKNWDYAYVRASTDGGRTWQLLHGSHMQSKDPSMPALGPGYTGKSGTTEDKAEWVRERLALDAFCGKQVTIRFDYLTDDAVNAPGLCLDDFCIEALAFHDDVESGEDGWHAEGFMRHDNRLTQNYLVQIVEFSSAPRIRPIPVDTQGRGEAVIEGFGEEVPRALLIVAATAPVTTETAIYRINLEKLP
ncbi:MAG: immune inhibitor A [Chloroflexota bacterium]|nr:immune inhibitor A [Chloroflexota bacterium]